MIRLSFSFHRSLEFLGQIFLTCSIPGPQPCKKLRKLSRGVVRKSSKLPQHAQIISDQSQCTNFIKSPDKKILDIINFMIWLSFFFSWISWVFEVNFSWHTMLFIVSEDGGRAIQSLNRAAATSTSKAPSFTIILKHTYVTGFSMVSFWWVSFLSMKIVWYVSFKATI